MISRLIRIAVNIVLICLFLALIGKFDAFLRNPLVTILLIGFHIKDSLIDWGASVFVGWLVCVVVTAYIVLCAVELFSFIYKKARRTIKNFGKE